MSLAFFLTKHPKLIKFALGGVAGIALLAGVTFGAMRLRDHYVEVGFKQAEAQYTAAITAKNEQVKQGNQNMAIMGTAIGALSKRQEQEVNLTLKPIFERIQDAVESNPVYRDCIIDQRVLDDLQAGRAAVNASIDSSNPGSDR